MYVHGLNVFFTRTKVCICTDKTLYCIHGQYMYTWKKLYVYTDKTLCSRGQNLCVYTDKTLCIQGQKYVYARTKPRRSSPSEHWQGKDAICRMTPRPGTLVLRHYKPVSISGYACLFTDHTVCSLPYITWWMIGTSIQLNTTPRYWQSAVGLL